MNINIEQNKMVELSRIKKQALILFMLLLNMWSLKAQNIMDIGVFDTDFEYNDVVSQGDEIHFSITTPLFFQIDFPDTSMNNYIDGTISLVKNEDGVYTVYGNIFGGEEYPITLQNELDAGNYILSIGLLGLQNTDILIRGFSSSDLLQPDIPGNPTQAPLTENRIITYNYTRENEQDSLVNIEYYDGLGTPYQMTQIGLTPKRKNIITITEYDGFYRKSKKWLPFISSGEGVVDLMTQYEDQYPYRQTKYEMSSLSRAAVDFPTGEDWQVEGKVVRYEYFLNNDEQELRAILFGVSGNSITTTEIMPYYNEGMLTVTKITDENGSIRYIFKDGKGQEVLSRSVVADENIDTYYIYDASGNLRFVLPPKLSALFENEISQGNQINYNTQSEELNESAYIYEYDALKRCIYKKLPGCAPVYFEYDRADQLIFSQDGGLRINNGWLFSVPDILGRSVLSGICEGKTNIRDSIVKAEYTGSGPYKGYNITLNDFDEYILLKVSYYDDYNFDLEGLTIPSIVLGQIVATQTKTLATGSKVRVLGTDHWITTLNAYDSKGRLIYTASKNPYLNTTDVVESLLDFTGKILKTRTTHTRGSNAPIVTTDIFEYDHAGRLLKQVQCLGGDCGTEEASAANIELNEQLTGHQSKIASSSVILNPGFHFKATSSASFSASISIPGELIAENVYDELGQLTEKKVGNTPQNPLQHIAYTYNVRGWLTDINDVDHPSGKLFNFQINYNKSRSGVVDPLYNGNIAETYWKTGNDNTMRRYAYSYDALNRITAGKFNGSGQTDRYTVEGITYDKNGNIEHLTRRGHLNSGATSFGVMDNLAYTYDTGNKLLKVTDSGNKTYGFKDGTNTGNDYTYDANGNLLTDANKGITGISYNHLNLPTQVSFGSNKIAYIYDASGAKLKKEITQGSSVTATEYANGYIYENGQLQFFSHPEGYVTKENNAYTYVYQYKDHLGNVRLSYTNTGTTSAPQLEIVEENNYYPFGLKHKGYNGQTSSLGNDIAQRWKFGGKELDESLGLGTYDFGARNYNPELGRWMNIDPLADDPEQVDKSPYAFSWNNPIRYVDPTGLKPLDDFIFDQNGDFVRIDENDQPDRLVIENSETGARQNYSFADPEEDTQQIRDGIINKVISVGESDIKDMLSQQGAFDPDNKDSWSHFYKESKGGQDFDYSYSVIPSRYGDEGASSNPLNNPSSVLFLPEGDYMAHNHMNFGNYLWAASGYTLGFNYSTLQMAAHGNSLINSKSNGYPAQWDSKDDQRSIIGSLLFK
ncbi:RHS repeat-associated core domain-containing protein [Sinomicrobium oceani]|uniref:RHS repeat-associated core domain-containing protein n=1 Tax=Sinomicrobium oceani TaxID=1150368 RepID=A0A1K1ME31_9FLAO|nr:DUF6443 domain-containing protein [Sinomicrobium oceani]SFW21376.1 RHS repeat-associated core domain-containing protein [Sinomicrobium oceani]